MAHDDVARAYSELKALRRKPVLTPAVVEQAAPYLTEAYNGSAHRLIRRLRLEMTVPRSQEDDERAQTDALILSYTLVLDDVGLSVQDRLEAVAGVLAGDNPSPPDPMTARRRMDSLLLKLAQDLVLLELRMALRFAMNYRDGEAHIVVHVTRNGISDWVPQTKVTADGELLEPLTWVDVSWETGEIPSPSELAMEIDAGDTAIEARAVFDASKNIRFQMSIDRRMPCQLLSVTSNGIRLSSELVLPIYVDLHWSV